MSDKIDCSQVCSDPQQRGIWTSLSVQVRSDYLYVGIFYNPHKMIFTERAH